jgi:hypothetical protein
MKDVRLLVRRHISALYGVGLARRWPPLVAARSSCANQTLARRIVGEPGERLLCGLVGGKDRIESRFDSPLGNDKRDALEVRPAVKLKGREPHRRCELQLLV